MSKPLGGRGKRTMCAGVWWTIKHESLELWAEVWAREKNGEQWGEVQIHSSSICLFNTKITPEFSFPFPTALNFHMNSHEPTEGCTPSQRWQTLKLNLTQALIPHTCTQPREGHAQEHTHTYTHKSPKHTHRPIDHEGPHTCSNTHTHRWQKYINTYTHPDTCEYTHRGHKCSFVERVRHVFQYIVKTFHLLSGGLCWGETGRQQPHLVIEPPFAIHSDKTDFEETSKGSTGLSFHTVHIPIPLQVNHWELRTTPSNQE